MRLTKRDQVLIFTFIYRCAYLLSLFYDSDKIAIVRAERTKIIQYAEKKLLGGTLTQTSPSSPKGNDAQKAASAMLEMVSTYFVVIYF